MNIELNALKEYHRDFLETLVEEGITNHIDMDMKHETESRITRRREAIKDCIDINYDALPESDTGTNNSSPGT